MMMKLTKRESDYLLTLLRMNAYSGNYISSVKLAEKLNVTPPTAVETLRKLADKGYVDYVKRKGAQLTCKGMKIARKLLRKHRILEVLVVEIAKIEVDRACSMIRGLELLINDELIELFNNALGNPRQCPHGYEIPEV